MPLDMEWKTGMLFSAALCMMMGKPEKVMVSEGMTSASAPAFNHGFRRQRQIRHRSDARLQQHRQAKLFAEQLYRFRAKPRRLSR